MDFLHISSFLTLRNRLLDSRNGLSSREKLITEKMLLHIDSRENVLEIALQYLIDKHHLCRGDAGVCSEQDTWYYPCSTYNSVNGASQIELGDFDIPNFLEPQVSVWRTNQPILFDRMVPSKSLPYQVSDLMTSIGTKSFAVSKIEYSGNKIGTICIDSTHGDFSWTDQIIGDIHNFNNVVLSSILWFSIHYSKAIQAESTTDFLLRLSNRELEMLELLTHGLSVKQIATELNVTEHAIRKRIKTCRNRHQIKNLVDLKALYKRALYYQKPNRY